MNTSPSTPSEQTFNSTPVFPLPNHVVLPGITMPYRLFEERYQALGAFLHAAYHKKADDDTVPLTIVIPCLMDGWESSYDQQPPFQRIACRCELMHIEKNEAGTEAGDNAHSDTDADSDSDAHKEWNILIRAGERCQLREDPSDQPFRYATLTDMPIASDMSNAALQQSLLDIAPTFCTQLRHMGADNTQLQAFLEDCTDGCALMNRMAHLLLSKPQRRQEYLEAPALSAQLHILRTALSTASDSA